MTLLDWLRRLGILRFGVEKAVYRNAAERPASMMMDNVLNSEKDVIHFGRKPKQDPPQGDRPEGE